MTHCPPGNPKMTRNQAIGLWIAVAVSLAAYASIAINQLPACGWASIEKLLAAGVIVRGQDEMRRDAMGVYAVPQFGVPLLIHKQWCQWCSEQQPEGQDG